MPGSADVALALLHEADARVDKHQWIEAAHLYKQHLDQLSPDTNPLETGRVSELLATSYFRGSFQQNSREEFCRTMSVARDAFHSAAAAYQTGNSNSLSSRSKAKALFANFWISDNSEDRRSIIRRCIALSRDAAESFEEQGEKKHLAETHNDLLTYFREAIELATESQTLVQQFEEAVAIGRKAISEFEVLGHQEGLLESLRLTVWLLAVEAQSVLDHPRAQALAGEISSLGKKIAEVSEKIGTSYALFVSDHAAADIAGEVEGNSSKALNLYQKSATSAGELSDSLASGRLLRVMAQATYWLAISEGFEERARELLERGQELTMNAIRKLEVPRDTTYLAAAYSTHANISIDLAHFVETEAAKKRALLEKAIEFATKGATFERGTWAWEAAGHAISKAMYFLALLESDGEKKARLLREALPVREETVRIMDSLFPHFWNRGIDRNYLALIKAQLANTEQDSAERIELLNGAISDMQQCLELCMKWATKPTFMQQVAQYKEWYGDILFRLYELTADSGQARNAIVAYEEALQYLTKSGPIGPRGTVGWKIARVQDALGDFRAAAKTFQGASNDYAVGAQKVPGLSTTFGELATYMKAWAKIEEARVHHREEDYGLASESYAEAAKDLQVSRNWSHFAGLCAARSLLEKGEAMSRGEKHTAALEWFSEAVKAFQDSRGELEKRLKEDTGAPETLELKEWLKIARQRETYSLGRLDLEKAKTLDKKGDKAASARKYHSASETFKTLAREIDSVQDRSEVETLADFCQAWARMKEADSKASPELYAEAAESFTRASESATRETFRLLAFANASICKALEAGTLFRLTRNAQFYSEIKKRLETAADYYQEAGFKKTGSWTRATQRLFDALVYSSDAESEKEPKKKAELYHLAEKYFELAARLYGEAGFPTKKEEALGHLERSREEKGLLLKPLEALSEIPTASGVSLTSLSLTEGQALGLERFEEAYVVGDMNIPQRELPVGSDFIIELEAANVGRAPATLVKLQDIVPEGLELDSEKSHHRIEDSFIDLEGKRLEHLKTHQVKVILKTSRKGVFELRPKLFFVDGRGNYKSYRFQASTLTVMELEIPVPTPLSVEMSPPKIAIPAEFRFETERAREVFQCLVKEFLSDYMSKRIYVEKAGWRSLMDLVRQMKIPRSALYGPQGRDGPTLIELERRGLVESRIFPKERGRGGAIKKVRVAYDNAIVKKIVEQTVVENK